MGRRKSTWNQTPVTVFLNVGADTAGNRFLEPYFFLPCLTEAIYHYFLQQSFQRYSKMFTYSLRTHLRFMHQVALPHFLHAVYAFSTTYFQNNGQDKVDH